MKYTSEVFKLLTDGKFLSSNSVVPFMRVIYDDVEEHYAEYADYFNKIDLQLEAGDGYYYFSRKENKVATEQKLKTFFNWIDIIDLLKVYDNTFSQGTQFSLAEIETRLSADVELKEKLLSLSIDRTSNRDRLKYIAMMLVRQGFAEVVDEIGGRYQVTSAFRYLEEMIQIITINEDVENEISE